MTQAVSNYAEVLLELGIPETEADEAERIFKAAPVLLEVFKNPLIPLEEKGRVIDRIFPESLRSFLKSVCRHGRLDEISEIFEGFRELLRRREGVLRATLFYVTPPDKAVEERIKAFLRQKYNKREAELILERDPSLIGGFLLQAAGCEYDYSLRGRYRRLSQALIRR